MRVSLRYVSFFVLVASLPVQMDPQQWLTVRGQLLVNRGIVPAGLQVELRSLDRHQPTRAMVMDDGTFEFHRMAAGHYEAKVINIRGEVIQQDFVSIRANGDPLSLRARWQEPAPPSGSVSWRQLLRPVPPRPPKSFAAPKTLPNGVTRPNPSGICSGPSSSFRIISKLMFHRLLKTFAGA